MQTRIVRIEQAAAHALTFWLKPERPLQYNAGQFVEVSLPHPHPDNRGERRWFTLSSSPTEPELAITSVFVPDGSTFKRQLQSLQAGDSLTISEPLGDFVLPKDSSIPLFFVGIGIGVTPFRSMTQWLADTAEQRTITMWHAARTADDLAFADLFMQHYGRRFTQFAGTGRSAITPHTIADTMASMPEALLYVAGPEAFVEACVKKLPTLGIDSYRIVGDYFPGYREQA